MLSKNNNNVSKLDRVEGTYSGINESYQTCGKYAGKIVTWIRVRCGAKGQVYRHVYCVMPNCCTRSIKGVLENSKKVVVTGRPMADVDFPRHVLDVKNIKVISKDRNAISTIVGSDEF